MDIFTKKECSRCIEYQKEVELLTLRNKRLEDVLIELKNRFTSQNNHTNIKEIKTLSQAEIDKLFQRIKQSSYDKDKKRYLRSILMLIKHDYEPSLHQHIEKELDKDN